MAKSKAQRSSRSDKLCLWWLLLFVTSSSLSVEERDACTTKHIRIISFNLLSFVAKTIRFDFSNYVFLHLLSFALTTWFPF